eukprot:Em0004g552a
MAESVVDIDGNGSFQNQTEDVASSSRSAARKAAAWKELLKKKPRGRYFANTKPHAIKELESLAGYMPDLSDTDARDLALRLYFIELADGVSPSVAQDKPWIHWSTLQCSDIALDPLIHQWIQCYIRTLQDTAGWTSGSSAISGHCRVDQWLKCYIRTE